EFRNGLSAPPRVQGRGTQFSSKQYRAARHEYRKDEDEDEFEDAPHTSGKNAIWIILAGILLLGGALAALVLTVFKPSP
ncbi:MAG TPA: hypothetical protein DEQ02_07485, partial [Ruminococcaceae bacterium]|nr:hypothetical protein [Oscillospiraceae bacterium]